MTNAKFLTAWNELTDNEKNTWEKKITKQAKQEKFGQIFVKDPQAEWDKKNKDAMRKKTCADYKPLLRQATTQDEYDKLFNECAVKLSAIGY